jgi:hypothetical protein
MHDNRDRAGILALAVFAMLAVVAPVSASSADPPACPTAARAVVVRIDAIRAHADAIRAHAVMDLDVDALHYVVEAVDYADVVDYEIRDYEIELFDKQDDGIAAVAAYPVKLGVDLLVGAARLPGRAALTARHLVEAVVKVTPRVVGALL